MSEDPGTATAVDDAARHKVYVIIVNGEQKTVPDKHVSYSEVVALAYPTPPSADTRFTVTYRKAKEPHHEGVLTAGHSVEIKHEGTIFNVKATGKS